MLNRNNARVVLSETAKVFARPKLVLGDAVETYVSATGLSVIVVGAATTVVKFINVKPIVANVSNDAKRSRK
jgi:hypothetical protein